LGGYIFVWEGLGPKPMPGYVPADNVDYLMTFRILDNDKLETMHVELYWLYNLVLLVGGVGSKDI